MQGWKFGLNATLFGLIRMILLWRIESGREARSFFERLNICAIFDGDFALDVVTNPPKLLLHLFDFDVVRRQAKILAFELVCPFAKLAQVVNSFRLFEAKLFRGQ